MENFNKFINHNDPTKKLDPNVSTIEEQYAKLTDEEKLIVGARMLGMKNRIPVDIKTFVFDEYFLGVDQITNKGKAIFPYWVDKLEEIFPNPIMTKYPYILFGGEDSRRL